MARRSLITTAITVFITTLAYGQYKVDNAKSNMTIDGTSNVHDWTEDVEIINGTMTAEIEGTKLVNISSINLSIPVQSIKSGKSTMDKNTYNAMNADKHPNIKYSLKSVSITGNKAVLEGTLTINGVAKTIKMNSDYKVAGNTIQLTGSYAFKMSEFKIEPPVAMMGAMKTGDAITVKFNVLFNK
jgi:polyisoprenoid-binding protein YceI